MKNKKKGFTMVELVVVIAVIGILAAVLIPTFSNITEKANKSAALQEAGNALTVVLTEENAELKTEQFDYYFFSGDYVYKYVDGKLTALTKSEMTALNVVVATNDEVYAKAGHKWIGNNGITATPTPVVSRVDEAADPDVTYYLKADGTETTEINEAVKENVYTGAIVHEIADMGGVVVWKDAKVSA